MFRNEANYFSHRGHGKLLLSVLVVGFFDVTVSRDLVEYVLEPHLDEMFGNYFSRYRIGLNIVVYWFEYGDHSENCFFIWVNIFRIGKRENNCIEQFHFVSSRIYLIILSSIINRH